MDEGPYQNWNVTLPNIAHSLRSVERATSIMMTIYKKVRRKLVESVRFVLRKFYKFKPLPCVTIYLTMWPRNDYVRSKWEEESVETESLMENIDIAMKNEKEFWIWNSIHFFWKKHTNKKAISQHGHQNILLEERTGIINDSSWSVIVNKIFISKLLSCGPLTVMQIVESEMKLSVNFISIPWFEICIRNGRIINILPFEDCKMYKFECNFQYYEYDFPKVNMRWRITKVKACVIFWCKNWQFQRIIKYV